MVRYVKVCFMQTEVFYFIILKKPLRFLAKFYIHLVTILLNNSTLLKYMLNRLAIKKFPFRWNSKNQETIIDR